MESEVLGNVDVESEGSEDDSVELEVSENSQNGIGEQ